MRTAHKVKDDGGSFQCPDCEHLFDDRAEFFDHCSEHAEITMCCPLCKVQLTSNEELTDHFKLHLKSDMYFCDYCNLIYMNSEDLDKHFIDQHSNELCSVGEEVEYVIEDPPDESSLTTKKRRHVDVATRKPSAKKAKAEMIEYDVEEVEDQYYEFINDEQFITEEPATGFVEYEEIHPKPKTEPVEKAKKTYSRNPKPEQKPLTQVKLSAARPVKVEKVKMSQAKIEQLKKEGKIKIINGEMVMTS